MCHQRRFRTAVGILLCCLLQVQGADKYTDENRPYEFGFNVEIDGSKQQHRHEKKDKDGIIMGEFGFVTADDVYHVTVYATDKEGRFKILSMKNIHLKKSSPAPAVPAITSRQGHSLALPASVTGPVAPAAPQAPPKPQPPFKQISLQPPGRSCSSCSLPTTTVVPPPNVPAPAVFPDNVQPGVQPFKPQVGAPSYSQQPGAQPFNPQVRQPNYPAQPQQNYPATLNNGPIPNAPNYVQPEPSGPFAQSPPQSSDIQPPLENYPQPGGQQYPNNPLPGQRPQGGSPGRTSKQYTGPEQQFGPQVQPGQPGPVKPTLVSAQMQIVDKNTDINALRPGETPGLPPGLSKNDMTQLLYTFNYTVGFHGHFEEGYTNGVKKGYYFVTGRNGIKTKIDYVADDTGFHPKVSQEVLDLLSDDVPKPETEKDAKYGLKGYEFKWLYYPVESKNQ